MIISSLEIALRDTIRKHDVELGPVIEPPGAFTEKPLAKLHALYRLRYRLASTIWRKYKS